MESSCPLQVTELKVSKKKSYVFFIIWEGNQGIETMDISAHANLYLYAILMPCHALKFPTYTCFLILISSLGFIYLFIVNIY